MKKFIGANKLLIPAIVALITTVFSSISLVAFNSLKKTSRSKEIDNVSAVVNIDSGLTGDQYESNFYFKISSENGYRVFYDFLQQATYTYTSTWWDGGWQSETITEPNDYFAGKTVFLECDIDRQNFISYASTYINPIATFAGTLDGQGHWIKAPILGNLRIKTREITYGNFCTNLTGVIKNVGFSGITTLMETDGFGNANTLIGGIVGTNSGTIDSCIVNGFTVVSDRWDNNVGCAPIAAINNGKIKNCIVQGQYVLGVDEDDGNGVNGYFFNVNGTGTVTSSVYVAEEIKYEYSEDSKEIYWPLSHTERNKDGSYPEDKPGGYHSGSDDGMPDGVISINSGSYTSFETAKSSFDSSVLSSSLGSTGTPWYQFKLGYTYDRSGELDIFLRSWVGWRELKFVATEGGSVDVSSLIIPLNYYPSDTNNVKSNKLTFYGSSINATANDGYEFLTWELNNNVWTAVFEQVVFTITFKNNPNLSVSETQFKVSKDASISIQLHTYLNGTYKECEFTFTEYGKTISTTITYSISNTSYYIKGYNVNDGALSTSKSYNVIDDITISVLTELKQYDIALS